MDKIQLKEIGHMGEYFEIFLIILFVIMFGAVSCGLLFFALKSYSRGKKLLGDTVNYDGLMRKLVFRIDLSREEFIKQLRTNNIYDDPKYNLNNDLSVITFQRFNKKTDYKLIIEDYSDYLIIKIEQIQLLAQVHPYYVNLFWAKKFNATPVNYEQFPF